MPNNCAKCGELHKSSSAGLGCNCECHAPNNKEKCCLACADYSKKWPNGDTYCHNSLCSCHRPAHSTEEDRKERIEKMAEEMAKQVPVEGGTNGTMTSTGEGKVFMGIDFAVEEPQGESWEKELARLMSFKHDYTFDLHSATEFLIRDLLSQTKREAYKEGQEDAFAGRIENLESITIKETINVPEVVRAEIRKEERQRILKIVEGAQQNEVGMINPSDLSSRIQEEPAAIQEDK